MAKEINIDQFFDLKPKIRKIIKSNIIYQPKNYNAVNYDRAATDIQNLLIEKGLLITSKSIKKNNSLKN